MEELLSCNSLVNGRKKEWLPTLTEKHKTLLRQEDCQQRLPGWLYIRRKRGQPEGEAVGNYEITIAGGNRQESQIAGKQPQRHAERLMRFSDDREPDRRRMAGGYKRVCIYIFPSILCTDTL